MSNNIKVVVIGGGAAGILAAITAKKQFPKETVVLLERNNILGRKILITGAGRCNLTNTNLATKPEEKYNHPDFVKTTFARVGYKEIVAWFNDLGLETKEEEKNKTGKIFPVSDRADSVVNLLTAAVAEAGVEVKFGVTVKNIIKQKNGFVINLHNGDRLETVKIILAAGGSTYPALGADGSGFAIAKELGHQIVTPVPSGVSLEGKSRISQELQGLKIMVEIVVPASKNVSGITGDLLFTKYGLSGMAVLKASRPISLSMHRAHQAWAEININFMPGYNTNTATKYWLERKKKHPSREVATDWGGVFPGKFAAVFLNNLGFAPNIIWADLRETDVQKIAEALTSYPWKITATRGWNEAEFTAGGVDTTEVNPDTLESKIIPGLYLAGEVLDIDGDIGGYNLSWAWASGMVAGRLGSAK